MRSKKGGMRSDDELVKSTSDEDGEGEKDTLFGFTTTVQTVARCPHPDANFHIFPQSTCLK